MADTKKQIYDVVVFEEYEKDGEKRSKSYQVGVAFESKDSTAMNVQLAPGIAVSGRFTILPRKDKDKTESP